MNSFPHENIPLTDAQQGVWYASQASHSSRLYATGQALYLRGEIEQSKLIHAIERALVEFDVLNHSFIDVYGTPSFGPLMSNACVTLCDLSFQDEPEVLAQQSMEQIIREELGPNCLHQHEHRLYILGKHEAIWFSRIHHIAFDAYAYHLLHQRAGAHYRALQKGESVVPCRFVGLRTLCAEDLAYRESSQYTSDHDYWTHRCAQMPTPTFLGTAAQEMAVDTIQAEEFIDAELSLVLDTFYQHNRIALSDMLLGVFASYFSSCLGGERKLLFGLPCMGRLDSFGAQAAITRSNILPLLLELPQDVCFQDVCAIVARSRRELLAHQRYRGEWIGRAIGRIGDNLPLYGIELNILPYSPTLDFEGLNTAAKHVATGPVRDLNVHLELGSDLRPRGLRLIANASRHNRSELQMHVRRLLYWMEQLIKAPELPLRELSLAMPAELSAIAQWNNTVHTLPAHNILQLFEEQVQAVPQQLAVLDETGGLTYSELELRSRQLAHALDYHLQGARGKVIGVALERCVELEVVLLAILRSGAVILPLSLELPELRLQKMLKQAGASLTISTFASRNRLPTGHSQMDIESLSCIAERLGNAALALPTEQCGTAPAYILFTSGSSGEPKGVMVGHLALANRLQWMQAEYSLQPTDRVLQKTPATFDVSMWEFFWPLISGATLVMARPGGHTDPAYLLSSIEQYNITTLHFVPSMLALFLDAFERRPGQLPLLRVFASGEALSPELVKRYHCLLTAPLHNLYGPTEAAIDVTYHVLGQNVEGRSVPIGRPIWNTRIHILNEYGRTTPIGIEGELYIEGICLADGYVGQPTLTAERFVIGADGERLYRTGDLARWREDGEIDYLGRLDQQIKIHGQRIELEEIDAVIGKHPQVHQACANMYEGRIIAYIVTNGVEPDEDELLAFCRKHLPVYMLPQRVMFLAELPLSRNGKLDRKILPAPPNIHREDGSVPSSLIEQRLCEYFADALQLPAVAPESNFFDLGGNSLSAVSVAARINAGLGWRITIANIFAHPTPRTLAGHGQHDDLNMLDTTLLLRPSPYNSRIGLPTLFCIHPAGGIAWCYSGLARFLKTPCEIVGLQAQGLTPEGHIAQSMDDMAEEYANRIRTHQPRGPYWLIGWSVGGMIAHSVAVRLEQQGQKVELLAMMDAYPSDLWRRFAFEDLNSREEESMAMAALLFIAGIALPFDNGLPSLIVPKGEVLERSQTIRLLRENGNALASLDDQTLDRLINVVINSRRLVGGSNHDIYHGDLLFFTAAAPRAEDWLDLEAWHPYVHGRIHNIDINCNHPAMARAEALREIAMHLDVTFACFLKRLSGNQQDSSRKKIVENAAK
ncbi:amino acid adenylation domain-containing protein [Brenneria goodwinii]|uniref:non-ribosomal peptide synthetase n=1 Tax=Brenneria goodwinii TaxID=1109412 RepID=UPI000EF2794A|nr:non-ribosomal peptide synthetase [Brenneria goodwinii]MCG8157793.1 amino acid adenylation domain-containing protein [Brenneria goodwinii]MCG8161740.1 amino acid adenylation domain-containing protein [Brenneria goodwinii]MCG8166626.1 amino acid adenylation domain-containing protein [Brenneria goodwinii]MCG8171416.1 amino acid adenylation domain-containing protein [Brenneria goodwinii]MCG8175377.1 amino acid adenylation domain-containing protein [Brenneria goodwinii]